MHTDIEKHRQALTAQCRQYGVVRLEVYGSAARGVDFEPVASDANFLVVFGDGRDVSPFDRFFGFSESLQRLL